MTVAEAHAIAVAVQTRRAELAKWREWYQTNAVGRAWSTSEMAAEHAIRLDELDKILLTAQAAEMTEAEHREMAGR